MDRADLENMRELELSICKLDVEKAYYHISWVGMGVSPESEKPAPNPPRF